MFSRINKNPFFYYFYWTSIQEFNYKCQSWENRWRSMKWRRNVFVFDLILAVGAGIKCLFHLFKCLSVTALSSVDIFNNPSPFFHLPIAFRCWIRILNYFIFFIFAFALLPATQHFVKFGCPASSTRRNVRIQIEVESKDSKIETNKVRTCTYVVCR